MEPEPITKWMLAQLEKWEAKWGQYVKASDMKQYLQERNFEVQRLHDIEMNDARARARLRAVHDAEALLLRMQVADGDWEDTPWMLKEIYTKINNRRGNGGHISEWYLVTVNPAPGHTIEDLTRRVCKFVHRRIVKEAYYAFEQRGTSDGDEGDGLHVHIVVRQRGDVYHGDFQRNARSTFRPLVGNDKAVNVKCLKTDQDVDQALKYIQGVKKEKPGEFKLEKVCRDALWRTKNNLQRYYHHINGKAEGESSEGTSQEVEGDDETATDAADE